MREGLALLYSDTWDLHCSLLLLTAPSHNAVCSWDTRPPCGIPFLKIQYCYYKNAKNFSDGTWVNISGEITKGDYHGTIPVIEIKDIKQCEKPKDEFVNPPDDTYIPTSALF